jgi:hypothetical protein
VYSQLNRLRFHPWYTGAFQSGTIDRSLGGAVKWIKVTTTGDTSDVVVVGNFDVNSQTATISFPVAGTWYDYFNNTTFSATGTAQNIALAPGQFFVYVNRNVNNLSTTPIGNVPGNAVVLEAKVFPNPATSQATLQFRLPVSGITSIDIVNALGQQVATLRNSFLQAGQHQVPVNAKLLQKGTYYLRINTKAGNQVLSLHIQ